MSSVNSKRGGPLQGVRVVELTKIWAGPETGKQLAYLGAEVIRIESEGAIDGTRILGAKDFNNAPGHQAVNPQKLSAQIDIKNSKGIELILDLIRESDMVIENLRPGAMERLGLGYDVIKSVNPNVICVSMSMYGNDGPLAYQTGYAPCFAAIGGLTALVGYEGETPTGINIRYGDPTYGAAGTFAGLVALLHRRNTGKGQFVDVSAVETMTTMIADSVMEHAINGVEHQCDGNRHSEMAPHNLYRCSGDDWVSIAVASEAAWISLADAMGTPALAEDSRFKSLADRKANENALDGLVGAWTSGRSVGDVVSQLQARGIAAGKSQTSIDMISDSLLWSRGFYPEVTEFDGTVRPTVGPGAKLTRSAAITEGAPALGKHTAYVLGEILGLSSEEQEQLAAAGITR